MNCCRSARINYVQEPSISLEVKETERQGGRKVQNPSRHGRCWRTRTRKLGPRSVWTYAKLLITIGKSKKWFMIYGLSVFGNCDTNRMLPKRDKILNFNILLLREILLRLKVYEPICCNAFFRDTQILWKMPINISRMFSCLSHWDMSYSSSHKMPEMAEISLIVRSFIGLSRLMSP